MMNVSHANDSFVISSKNMLMDYENIFNETNNELIVDGGNDTTVTESEDYDVKSYLESILGPQRQPSEKVRALIAYVESKSFGANIHI